MPTRAIQEYLQQMPSRLAELKIILAEVFDLPWMKPEDRQESILRWMETAGIEQGPKIASEEEMNEMGLGMHHDR